MQEFFIPTFFSTVYSLAIIAGIFILFDWLGKAIFKNHEPFWSAAYIVSGLLITSTILFILCYCKLITVQFLRLLPIMFLTWSVLIIALDHRYRNTSRQFIKHTISHLKGNRLVDVLIALCLFGFLVMSLSTPTDADSLDYHIGIPLEILRNGDLNFNENILHFRFIGFGEMINLIGLANGCPQLGSVLQYFLLLLFILIAIKLNGNKNSTLFILFIIGIPVLFFLLPSQKHQLTGILCTSIFFYILYYKYNDISTGRFALLCSLLIFPITIKYSFILSVASIWAYIMLIHVKYKTFTVLAYRFAIFIFLLLIFYSPILYQKYLLYGDPFSPLFERYVQSPGIDIINFSNYIRNYTDGGFPFPLSLIFPKSFGIISTVIGLSFIVALLFTFINKHRLPVLIIVILYSALVISFGQKTSRFFVEPYYWMLPGLFSCFHNRLIIKTLKTVAVFSITVVVIIQLIVLPSFTSGIISDKGRYELLKLNAQNFEEIEWVKSIVPADKTVGINTRSRALLSDNVLPREYYRMIQNSRIPLSLRIDILKKHSVEYIVLKDNDKKLITEISPYYHAVLVDGPKIFSHASRNPVNRSKKYSLNIYKISLSK